MDLRVQYDIFDIIDLSADRQAARKPEYTQ